METAHVSWLYICVHSFADLLIVGHHPVMVEQLMNTVGESISDRFVLRTTHDSPKTIPNPEHFRSVTLKLAELSNT